MTVQEAMSCTFEIQVNTHIAHLQTTSFAAHKALNEIYDNIVDLRDRFIESYQGKYGIISGYKSIEVKEGVDMVKYLQEELKKFEEFRLTLTDGYLQQIMDDIIELVTGTIYKLKFLK